MILLDGKAVAAKLRSQMSEEVAAETAKGKRPPQLAVILVGDDQASQIYVRNKSKACQEVGITSLPFILPANASEEELEKLVATLNDREDVDGILLQLPLPKGMNAQRYIELIDPAKDVDGFHPVNMGKLSLDLRGFTPCTPAGILELLKNYNLDLNNKKAVVIGRSNIVGKPLANLLSRRNINATVTLCHSGTKDLKQECLQADFIFAAIGKPKAITADMLPDGCVVVDVGINRAPDGLCGDVDFENAREKVKAITPVPGGVGPMTIAMLLRNTIDSWKQRIS